MTDAERIDQLETRLDQVQMVNEKLFNLVMRAALLHPGAIDLPMASDMIRMMAADQEDQGNHIAAHLMERIAALTGVRGEGANG